MPNIEEVLKFGVELLAIYGGAGVIGVMSFQYLGKKWIEGKFSERLKSYEHQQKLELSRLRIEVDSLLSGALKLQESEFELLPEAWEKLDEAYGSIRWAMSPAQEFADVERMTNDELDEFLAKFDIRETQKQDIRSSSNKGKTFQEISYWYRIQKAKVALSDVERFIARRGIFFPLELKQNFLAMLTILRSALISHQMGHETSDRKMQHEGWKRITDEAEPLYKAIEEEIHSRLRSHGPGVKIR